MKLLDDRFVPGRSRVAFRFGWGLKAVDPGDKAAAVQVHIGGVGYWKSPTPPLTYFELCRDGSMIVRSGCFQRCGV